MIDELAGGALKIIGRLFTVVLVEILLEILIKGTGYRLLRLLPGAEREFDSVASLIAGFVFWSVLGLVVYLALGAVELPAGR